jgi:nanoRNase/pAp phosphatase (c-di-AMP/oligoRNAs hydrolase)
MQDNHSNKTENTHVCIYHKNCADGFGAALAFKHWADTNNVKSEFIPAQYGDAVPAVEGKEVVIVDFSYPRAVLLDIQKRAKTILVIDHHKTAKKDLEGLDFCVFNLEKSGAVLTWEYFFPESKIPDLLLYIQDRDLWQWKLENSRQVSAAIRDLDMRFGVWERYLHIDNILELAEKGSVILEHQNKQVKKIVASNIALQNIAGYDVPCVNSTSLISEIGGEISKGFAFGAVYFETNSKRVYGLRSSKDGVDVSKIAAQFGGGGHYHAAGFSIEKPVVELA